MGYVRSPQSHSLFMLMMMNLLATFLQHQVVWLSLFQLTTVQCRDICSP
ncbi:Uncharacterised protein [Vibrio cholerae]|nr:Uncharacterised protein [Vibrio cholerae]CSI69631.1 Uncharacterised protein [Vibrio cholerae]